MNKRNTSKEKKKDRKAYPYKTGGKNRTKKIFLLMFVMILLVGTTSAFTVKSFDDTVGDYGKITIEQRKWYDPFGWVFEKNVMEKELIENTDKCLIDCYSEGKTILYQNESLFDKFEFEDKNGEKVDFNYNVYIEQEITFYQEVNKVIGEIVLKNGTTILEIKKENKSFHKLEWVEYNYEVLPSGTYKWRLEGRKSSNIAIDWVGITTGIKLREWAWYDIYDGTFEIFNTTGADTFSVPSGVTNVSVLVVGGGAGGGGSDGDQGAGGGGGAGGLIFNISYEVTPLANIPIYVGSGGAGGVGAGVNRGSNGTNSTFGSSIAYFGGGGGSQRTAYEGEGSDGANGGGQGGKGGTQGGGGTAVYGSQGNDGGGGTGDAPYYCGGGGGGHTQAGSSGSSSSACGSGGNGTEYWGMYFAGGGGAGVYATGGATAGQGGLGGGGAGTITDTAIDGIDGKGGGGGGVGGLASLDDGGDGGDGIVIVRYVTPDNVPTVTLNTPIDTYNSSLNSITFNATVSDDINLINVSLYLNGVINETNSSGFSRTHYYFTKTFEDGDYFWTIEAFDNSTQNTTATTRNFSVDTIVPLINISSPNETSYDYLVYENNFTLNTTITDTNLDKCWYNYNNTNTTFPCSSGVSKSQNLTITNHTTVTIYANDSFGHLSSDSFSWTYNLFDFNEYSYVENITESTPTTFSGKFQTGSSLSSSYLEYNNTNHSISIGSLGNNQYTLTSSLTTPSVNTDTNITWFFWVNNINATSYNQTVTNINLDNCDTYAFYLVNYTLVDELLQENINNTNSTIETTIIIKTIAGGEIAQFNKTFNGTATASICSEFNLNTSGLRLWEQSRYGSTDHVFEQHNIQNASMTSLPNEITLRDLPSTSATTFRIQYKSASFLPIANAVVEIQRKYLGEGIFKVIESPLTDTSGETSASLDLNSVLYRIIVSKNGETLATFENPAIACDNILTGDCSITINERDSATLINNYDVENNFNYGLYQENRTITLTFSIPSGENRLVNLFVNQSTILGNKTSCNQTLYATSGQLQCDIAEGLGDVYLVVDVSADNILIRKASSTILEDRSQYFGTNNIVLTFFLVLSLVLLMVSSPITVLIGLVIGLIASSLMLLLNSGDVFGVAPVLTYLIIIVILLIVKISGRENR